MLFGSLIRGRFFGIDEREASANLRGGRHIILLIVALRRKNFFARTRCCKLVCSQGIVRRHRYARAQRAKTPTKEHQSVRPSTDGGFAVLLWFDFGGVALVNSISLLGGRPMVGLQTLNLAIGVRVPASQPFNDKHLRAALD